MNLHSLSVFSACCCLITSNLAFAGETIQLDTAIIKGDKESPAILYIVPWKDMNQPADEYKGLVIDDLQNQILAPQLPRRELLNQ